MTLMHKDGMGFDLVLTAVPVNGRDVLWTILDKEMNPEVPEAVLTNSRSLLTYSIDSFSLEKFTIPSSAITYAIGLGFGGRHGRTPRPH